MINEKAILGKAKKARFFPPQPKLHEREYLIINYTYLCLKYKEIDYKRAE